MGVSGGFQRRLAGDNAKMAVVKLILLSGILGFVKAALPYPADAEITEVVNNRLNKYIQELDEYAALMEAYALFFARPSTPSYPGVYALFKTAAREEKHISKRFKERIRTKKGVLKLNKILPVDAYNAVVHPNHIISSTNAGNTLLGRPTDAHRGCILKNHIAGARHNAAACATAQVDRAVFLALEDRMQGARLLNFLTAELYEYVFKSVSNENPKPATTGASPTPAIVSRDDDTATFITQEELFAIRNNQVAFAADMLNKFDSNSTKVMTMKIADYKQKESQVADEIRNMFQTVLNPIRTGA